MHIARTLLTVQEASILIALRKYLPLKKRQVAIYSIHFDDEAKQSKETDFKRNVLI